MQSNLIGAIVLLAIISVGAGAWYLLPEGDAPFEDGAAYEVELTPEESDEIETFFDEAARTTHESDESVAGEPRAQYSLSNERLTLVAGTAGPDDERVWAEAALLLPLGIEANLETVAMYDSPSDDTLAFVDDEDGNGAWRMGFNVPQHLASDERERALTIIHEAAHTLTLSARDTKAAGCGGYETAEGCFLPTSYIGAFVNRFWQEQRAYDPHTFVTDYAAESPEEDIAESFAYYVVRPIATGTSTADSKVAFFHSYPELRALRAEMRGPLLSLLRSSAP